VLNGGRLVETGTHHELLARGGLYARLFDIQFKPQLTGLAMGNGANGHAEEQAPVAADVVSAEV
jgi:hypothetical protein